MGFKPRLTTKAPTYNFLVCPHCSVTYEEYVVKAYNLRDADIVSCGSCGEHLLIKEDLTGNLYFAVMNGEN